MKDDCSRLNTGGKDLSEKNQEEKEGVPWWPRVKGLSLSLRLRSLTAVFWVTAVARVQSLAWERPYAMDAIKMKREKEDSTHKSLT